MSAPVEVVVRLAGEDASVGRLWGHGGRGTESATFAYSDEWLARHGAYALEPALPLVAGPIQTEVGRPLFRSFAISLLLRAGSSLGGARPKAHIRDPGGSLAIAKFPSVRADEWNVMAWEKTALDIASAAGLETPSATLVSAAGRSVLVVERFDRVGTERIGYISAMTMLEATDGDPYSYTEIADAITAHSSAADQDLRELWGRMALSLLISNTDDHLRNHGFLRKDRAGWRLAPLFDVNPDPDPGNDMLTTSIDGGDGPASVERLVAVAPYFRLGDDEALAILQRVDRAVSRWRSLAVENGIGDDELGRLEPAFEHARRAQARRWIADRVGA